MVNDSSNPMPLIPENVALFGANPADLASGPAIDRPAVQHDVDWLAPQQNLRRERMRQYRLLFDGHHRAYFVAENRTQFSPQIVRLQLGNLGLIYVPLNVMRLLSLKSADLLIGELPAIRTSDQSRQDETDALLSRSNFHRVLFQVAIEASWASQSYFELIRWGGDVYVQHAPAAEIFPVGPLQPNGQYASYVRFSTADVGTARSRRRSRSPTASTSRRPATSASAATARPTFTSLARSTSSRTSATRSPTLRSSRCTTRGATPRRASAPPRRRSTRTRPGRRSRSSASTRHGRPARRLRPAASPARRSRPGRWPTRRTRRSRSRPAPSPAR